MNDFFKKGPDSTKVVDYLKAENAYLDTMLSGAKKFREDLFNEMKGRIKEKDESVPIRIMAIVIIRGLKKENNTIYIVEKKKILMLRKK